MFRGSKSALSTGRHILGHRRHHLRSLLRPKQLLRRLGLRIVGGSIRRLTQRALEAVATLLAPQAGLVVVPVRASRRRRHR